jgi:GTPase
VPEIFDMNRNDRSANEKAILVGLLQSDKTYPEDPLEELSGLADAAGIQVLGELTQRRDRPTAATYLGKGKIEELSAFIETVEADLVIFDNDLAPAQTRNLEKSLDIKVIDRTELILDIFAARAQTYQSRLAVELAQLEYAMPRLRRMWTHLSRQAVGGVGLRGPGEKQLEVDRRLATKRVHDLKKELQVIERRKQREVAGRGERMTVCLVGYTNAGKSTLMHTLTEADVFVKDMLFATLDTRTRRWQLPGWGPVLLSDTVGFVRNLPHHLVESFKATLEEARQADLLLHMADASNPRVYDQVTAAYEVLAELGIEEKNTLLVLNKIDAMEDRALLGRMRGRWPEAVEISAQSGEGIEKLTEAVSDALSRGFLELEVEMGVENGRLMAQLAAQGEIFSKHFDENRVTIHCRLPRSSSGILHQEGVEVRIIDRDKSGTGIDPAD